MSCKGTLLSVEQCNMFMTTEKFVVNQSITSKLKCKDIKDDAQHL